jgi:hypothetical protein
VNNTRQIAERAASRGDLPSPCNGVIGLCLSVPFATVMPMPEGIGQAERVTLESLRYATVPEADEYQA